MFISLTSNSVSLTHVTVAYNEASSGGGVFMTSGAVTFEDTLLAGNANGNFASSGGTATSNGHNLGDDDSTTGFFTAVATDLSNTPAKLSTTLAANSGRTPTYALLSGSLAAGGGDSSGPSVDQRGLPWLKAPSDIGSY